MNKTVLIGVILSAGLLAACEPTTPPELEGEYVGRCEQPHDQRDRWMAEMLAKGNSPETIEEIRGAYLKRGSNPDESGSYNAVIALLTGQPNRQGPKQTANYKACFDRFAK